MATSSPKRTYHHGDLRQSLIDAACRYLRENSADTLSLRALAREIGVSQTAPYRHFESRNALFAAIATQGFEMLTADLIAASEREGDNVEEAIIAVGITYVTWAIANPERYQMFFDSSLLDFNEYADLSEAGGSCFEVLLGLIRQGQAEGILIADHPAQLLAGTVWASVHGTTSLLQKNEKPYTDARKSRSVPQALNAVANNLRAVMEMVLNSVRKPC